MIPECPTGTLACPAQAFYVITMMEHFLQSLGARELILKCGRIMVTHGSSGGVPVATYRYSATTASSAITCFNTDTLRD